MKYLIIMVMIILLNSCTSKNKYEDLIYKDQLIVDLLIKNILHGCVDLGKTKPASKGIREYVKKYGEPTEGNKVKWQDGLHDWCNDSRVKYSAKLFFEFNNPNIYIQIDGYKVSNNTIQIAQKRINDLLQTDKVTITIGKNINFTERHINIRWLDDKKVKVSIGVFRGPLSGWEDEYEMIYRNGKWRSEMSFRSTVY